MQNFQVIHDGRIYLVEGGDPAELQQRITETIRSGGGFVTFDAAADYDTDGPVSIFVSSAKTAHIVLV
ncbi:hypothetical protein ACFQ9V_14745 [Leifsonia sp. NPDC056665]|uniref:hypothetical protein n=1 Tax=Leifsonia sp. NPDC056665 TaxID=3345901 RepID=UPI00367722C8